MKIITSINITLAISTSLLEAEVELSTSLLEYGRGGVVNLITGVWQRRSCQRQYWSMTEVELSNSLLEYDRGELSTLLLEYDRGVVVNLITGV